MKAKSIFLPETMKREEFVEKAGSFSVSVIDIVWVSSWSGDAEKAFINGLEKDVVSFVEFIESLKQ